MRNVADVYGSVELIVLSYIFHNQDGDFVTNDTGKGIFLNKTTKIVNIWFHNILLMIYSSFLEI